MPNDHAADTERPDPLEQLRALADSRVARDARMSPAVVLALVKQAQANVRELTADRDRARDLAAALEAENVELRRLVSYALHLRMYGERAPGGNETWRQFDRDAETVLRRAHGHCASCGRISNDEQRCDHCRRILDGATADTAEVTR